MPEQSEPLAAASVPEAGPAADPEGGPTLVPFDEVGARVDELVALFETHPDPATRERMEELLHYVDALHRTPLKRLVALLETYEWDGGGFTIPPLQRVYQDPLLRRMLQLYDLLPEPVDPQVAVERALDQVRPYIESHGGDVRAVAVAGGVVTVDLAGHCRGCTASRATLRGLVEAALREHVPGFQRMEIVEPEEPVAAHPPPSKPLISIEQLVASLPALQERR